jgi:F-type H+-transporting ATPase subunit b
VEALGISLGAFVWYLISFLILYFALQRLLFRPVLNVLENRQRIIRESMENAEQVKQQVARAQQDYEGRVAEARQEAARIIAQANERAQVSAQEIVAQAQADAERIRLEAQQQAEQEREQMLRGLQTQLSSLVIQTASTVVGQELKGNSHDKLIQQAIADLGRL